MRTTISERHKPVALALWHVAKRYGCNKDLRRLLMQYLAKRLFTWETELLVLERRYQNISERVLVTYVSRVAREIDALVDRWDNGHDNTDPVLRLTRVTLRKRYYLKPCDHWMWLNPTNYE